MDPLTAFSLAAGILQFVDFTSSFIKKTYEVYNTGELSDHISIEAATLRLVSLTECIKSSNQNNMKVPGNSVAHSALNDVAAECLDIAKQINDALSKFKPKNNGRLESARVALQTMFKKKKLEELERQLSRCRQEMLVNFVVLIQASTDSINQRLDILEEAGRSGHRRTQDDLKVAVTKILVAIETPKSWGRGDVDLNEVVCRLQQFSICTAAEQAFLDDLYLPILEDRERQIVEAADETFHWIFEEGDGASSDEDVDTDATGSSPTDSIEPVDDADSNAKDVGLHSTRPLESTGFEDWLSTGKGIFWITGKPGCGKSTLMKHISKHLRTHAVLRRWAGNSELVTAAAYFWISGDPRQRSLIGLWRSLFYNILSKHPSLIRSLFPWRWRQYERARKSSEEFGEDEFLRAMEKLPLTMDRSYRFCFFIDGLDEFQGDHKRLAKTLHELAKNDNLKICVSSRPWETFRASFIDDPIVEVDDWTRTDIRKFTVQQLDEHPIWASLVADTPEAANELIGVISSHSSGVFLWVHLVIQELKTAMEEGDTVAEMLNRLEGIPADLNGFFKRMLDNLPSQYQDQAKRYLSLTMTASEIEGHLIWMYFYTEERISNFGEVAEISPLSVSAALSRYESMKRRIENRCRDLLYVWSPYSDPNPNISASAKLAHFSRCDIRFTHRSVKDFLLSEGLGYIESIRDGNHQKSAWDIHNMTNMWRLQSALAEMKRLPLVGIEPDALSLIRYFLLRGTLDQDEPSLEYLEELKRAGESTMSTHEIEWPSLHDPKYPFQSFLDMAIAYGWNEYVKRELLLHNEELGVDQESFERLFSFVGMVNTLARSKHRATVEDGLVVWMHPPLADMAATLQNCSQKLYEQRGDEFCWVMTSGREPNIHGEYWAKLVRSYRSGEQEVRMTYRWNRSKWYEPYEDVKDWDGWLRDDCFICFDLDPPESPE